jgi:hypothetical protein
MPELLKRHSSNGFGMILTPDIAWLKFGGGGSWRWRRALGFVNRRRASRQDLDE